MVYRPEIDGLRALAVLAVIFSHADFVLFSGGFVGVDVFFVISGYLITSIIYSELQENRFSLINFYERRTRRILPALFFVILACIPFAWMWMMPNELQNFSKSIVKVNLFISNFYFWQEVDYFAADAQLSPLLHTWSLAVEEQFYVLFPLVLILFRKTRKSFILASIIVMVGLSIGLSEWQLETDVAANYYLLPTRAWELGIGSVIAMTSHHWSRTNGLAANILSLAGFILIIFAVVTFDEGTPFPGLWALFPVIGTALIIAYAHSHTMTARMLGWKPMVAIGLVSYSAYLWHQPIYAFARIRMQNEISEVVYLALIALTFGLSYFTWRYIEQPFRKKTLFTRKTLFWLAFIISTMFIITGKVGRLSNGFPERFPQEVRDMVAWTNNKNLRSEECRIKRKESKEPENSCIYGQSQRPKFTIIGDSHAMTLTKPLSQLLSQKDLGLRELIESGCPPIVGYRSTVGNDSCFEYNNKVQKYLAEHNEIETVVVFSLWTIHFEGDRFDNNEGGVAAGRKLTNNTENLTNSERIEILGKLTASTIKYLLDNGKRIILVYPVPEVGWHVPNYLSKQRLFNGIEMKMLSTSHDVFKERTMNTNQQLDRVIDHPNLLRVKPENLFCDSYIKGRCIAQLDGKPLYFDDNHLNSIGAEMLSKQVIQAMEYKGWL